MGRLISLYAATSVLLFSGLAFFSEQVSCDENNVYSTLVTIEGDVSIFEPETKQFFTKGRQHLVFQRTDCKKCVVVAFTDSEGHYSIRVGEGKYRLILEEDLSRGGSSLDTNQTRIVDARDKVIANRFDIKLVRHKSPNDVD